MRTGEHIRRALADQGYVPRKAGQTEGRLAPALLAAVLFRSSRARSG